MIELFDIHINAQGNRIDYSYRAQGKAEKYISKENSLYVSYDCNMSSVPASINIIPFVCNWLPIAWFGGFDLVVPELDKGFFESMTSYKTEFEKQFPEYTLSGKLKVGKLISNDIKGEKGVMLFSGGVDAYTTLIRNYDKMLDLATIHGADIEINDHQQWGDLVEFIKEEPLLKTFKKTFIETNVRSFYTYHAELLLKNIGWWGKVQHGISLIGSLAPISYVNRYSDIYIASSYTKEVDIAWGSTPQCDELISWANIRVHHDGYELKRQDKVDLINAYAEKNRTPFRLRVCYSELRTEFNCSNCEKCFRTILGIILNNQDPNKFGFKVDETIYKKIFKSIGSGSSSIGLRYFWWELMQKSKETKEIFIFNNTEQEQAEMDRIRKGEIDTLLSTKLINKSNGWKQRLLFIVRNRLPWMVSIYRKLRSF